MEHHKEGHKECHEGHKEGHQQGAHEGHKEGHKECKEGHKEGHQHGAHCHEGGAQGGAQGGAPRGGAQIMNTCSYVTCSCWHLQTLLRDSVELDFKLATRWPTCKLVLRFRGGYMGGAMIFREP